MTIEAKRRVLHVTECYSTGVARAILGIVATACDAEHYLLHEGFEEPPTDGPFAQTTRMLPGHLARVKQLARMTRELDIDVVHLHSSWAGVYGRVRRLEPVVLYQPHCFSFEDVSRPIFQRSAFKAAERWLAKNSDVIVAVSARERLLGQEIASNSGVVLLPNRSNLNRIDHRSSVPTRPLQIMMLGEIRAQKDPGFFALVAARARADQLPLEFVWVGDGDEQLRSMLGESGVRVTGWIGEDKVRDELDSASVYLHTALYEGFPLSILDAAARKIPIMIRRSPAFDGLGLHMFASASEAVGALRSLVEGDYSKLETNTHIIDAAFDPSVIPTVLGELYARERS